MSEWQPIETAPMDGVKVLIYDASLGEIFASEYRHGMWQTSVWTSHPRQFTHWMPLPPAP